MSRDMMVQRKTAVKYLEMIVNEPHRLLEKVKVGNLNYYINTRLIDLFMNHQTLVNATVESIESIHETESCVPERVKLGTE